MTVRSVGGGIGSSAPVPIPWSWAFDDGAIAIYIAAKKPEGVPEEDRLPINRKEQGLDIIIRVCQPDLEKMNTWQAPKAELVK